MAGDEVRSSLIGTLRSIFGLGGTAGVAIKNSGGTLLVRNAGDSADAELTTSKLHNSGDTLEINSAAAGSGADWKLTLGRPSSGMTAAVNFNFPIDHGSAGQVLSTDGGTSPTQTSWVSAANTAPCVTCDTTTLNFNSSSTITMFTLPANAVVHEVQTIIDTLFDGTSPSMTVGKSGSTSKYVGANDTNLASAAKTKFITDCAEPPSGSTEALIITFSAATGSPTQGVARILVFYSVPQ